MNRLAYIYFLAGVGVLLVYGLLDPQYFTFPKCPFLTLTGWMCPGCGSQRAIHQVLHGRITTAFQLNALFIPALLYGLIGNGIAFFSPEYWPRARERWFSIGAAKISIVVIVFFWIGRNII